MHLPDEGFDVDAELVSNGGIEVGNGVEDIVVGLEKEAMERAGDEGFPVVAIAKTEVESISSGFPCGGKGLL